MGRPRSRTTRRKMALAERRCWRRSIVGAAGKGRAGSSTGRLDGDGWKTLRFGKSLELQRGHDLPCGVAGIWSGTCYQGHSGVTRYATQLRDGPGISAGAVPAIVYRNFRCGSDLAAEPTICSRLQGNDPR